MSYQGENKNYSGLEMPIASTISSEVDRLFKVVTDIESKVFPPRPVQCAETGSSDNNLVDIRNDISMIADRLTYINEGLTFIGK